MKKFSGVKKMVLLANLTAVAIVLGIVETYLGLRIVPGAKLGLSNLIGLVVLYMFGPKEAFLVTITRVFMVGILSGTLMDQTFQMGLGGALLSLTVMSVLKQISLGVTVTSLFGSISHQIGQIIVAVIAFDTVEIVAYLYIMIPLGIVTGLTIGFVTEKFLIHYNANENND